jgi:ADP-ribose pyrophosphatase YjhB (NUDIX family)
MKKAQTKYNNPLPAVDIIIKYQNGIVLITRKNGELALPGGFVEYETTECAAIREAKEETGLRITIERLLGVYSDPKRDPRHVMSVVYVAKGTGKLKAGDDAQGARVVQKIPAKLAFDHNKILRDYLRTEKNGK